MSLTKSRVIGVAAFAFLAGALGRSHYIHAKRYEALSSELLTQQSRTQQSLEMLAKELDQQAAIHKALADADDARGRLSEAQSKSIKLLFEQIRQTDELISKRSKDLSDLRIEVYRLKDAQSGRRSP